MPAATDHNRRDALAAAYAEIQLELGKYRRRFLEAAKADIDKAIADATATGGAIDGTRIGREAAAAAISSYLGPEIHDPVDAAAAPAAALTAAPDA